MLSQNQLSYNAIAQASPKRGFLHIKQWINLVLCGNSNHSSGQIGSSR